MNSKLLVTQADIHSMNLDQKRGILGELTEESLRLISERSKYGKNPAIYKKGTIGEQYKNISFLEYALIEKERYFGKIGLFGDELTYPITEEGEMQIPVNEFNNKKPRFQDRIEVPDFAGFYSEVIDSFCEDGKNTGLAELIVDLDVDAMHSIHKRLQFGRYIIDAKLVENSDFRELLEDYTSKRKQDVLKFIVIPEQEARVIEKTIDYSESSGLNLNTLKIPWLIQEYIRMNTHVQFQHIKGVYGIDLSNPT